MTKRKRKPTAPPPHPTLGLVAHELESVNEWWQGALAQATAQDVNLISFFAGIAWETDMRCVVHRLIGPERLDGVGLAQRWPTVEAFETAYQQYYHPLPVVNAHRLYPGVPGAMAGDYAGMYAAISHLVQAHGCRRIAFIQGPENDAAAADRSTAYKDVLAAFDLPFDPALVTAGDFSGAAGAQAMTTLLDERQLRPGVDFDAVVATHDLQAIAALETLRARDIRVPQEVAVVGFGDIAAARFTMPALTTVKIPVYDLGYTVVEMLLSLVRGQPTPEQILVPAGLVIRESCGCLPAAALDAALAPASAAPETEPLPCVDAFATAGAALLADASQDGAAWGARLLAALQAEVCPATDAPPSATFLRAFYELLGQLRAAGTPLAVGQARLSALRQHVTPALAADPAALARAENCMQQARVLLAEVAQQAQAQQTHQALQRSEGLRQLAQTLLAAPDLAAQMDILARELPRLEIPAAYLSLYLDPTAPAGDARLALAYNATGRASLADAGVVFPARQLVPATITPAGRRYNWIVEPLYFQQTPLGFIVFEVGPQDVSLYTLLSHHISVALQSVLFVPEQATLRHSEERRARRAQAVAEVSQVASRVLDPAVLLAQAVALIQERLDLYYAGVFLLDEDDEKWAVLRAASGAAGPQMLAEGYKLEVADNSTIGQCIARREPRLALDVGAAAGRFDAPFLPQTRSELALPLIGRDQVWGALTLHSAQPAAFDLDDIAVLQTLADRLADALTGARLYASLHDEQRLLRTLIDTIPDYIYIKDRQSRFVINNRAHLQLLGAETQEEVTGKTDFDIFTSDLAARYYAEEQVLFQSGAPLLNQEELTVSRGTGKSLWVSHSKIPLRDAAGKITGFVGVTRDITELKRTEEVLLRRNVQLEAVSEVSRLSGGAMEAEMLLQQVVDLVKDRLDLYYAGVFLVDSTGRWAVLQAGAGEVGRQLAAQGHQLEVGGDSMIGWCVAHRQARIALDVGRESVRKPHPMLPDTRSELALPLISRGRAIGALTIQSDQPAAFGEQDVAVLQSMADQLANAVENVRLRTQTQAQVAEMQILQDVSESVAGMTDLDAALDATVAALSDAMGFTYIAINLIDEAAKTIQTPRAMGWAASLAGLVRPMDQMQGDILMDVVRQREIEVIDGWDERLNRELFERAGHANLVRVYVPLIAGDVVIGVLEVGHHRQERATVTPAEVNLLRNIADRVAVAVENARLLEQTRTALTEMQAVQQRYQQQAWVDYLQVAAATAYETQRPGAAPLGDAVLPEVRQVVAAQRTVARAGGEGVAAHAALAVPITLRDQVIGVLGIHDEDGARQWSADEVALLEAVAERMGQAAETLRLLDETQRAAARERLTGNVAAQMRASLDVDTVLQTAARAIGEALGLYDLTIELGVEREQGVG